MKTKLLLALFLSAFLHTSAKVTMPPLFCDNMILQQQSSAAIWGSSDSKKGVVIVTPSWDNKSVKAKVDTDGNWRVSLATPSHGGPYTITIDDGSVVTLQNILIGEVWIASGQSNMEMPMCGFNSQHVENSNRDVATSKDPNLRIMNVTRAVSAEPTTTITSDGWQESCSEVVKPISATAYYFARTLRESLDIPIGILVSSWGGTSINSWVCPEDANSYEDVIARPKKSSPNSQHYPGGLYNGMINPIAGFTAKGFIWYQGESDRMRHETYAEKMLDMVTKWRKEWGNDDMPFIYAQIAPFEYTKYNVTDTLSAYMREAQVEALEVIPNSNIVILSDAGLEGCIHPSNKQVVGERFAYQALNKVYGQSGVVADAPLFKSLEIKDNTLVITFDNAEDGLTTHNEAPRDFEIAGEDKIFVPASARVRGNTVIVSNKNITSPIYVRYGFKNWFNGNLFNLGGLPASSFRNDR